MFNTITAKPASTAATAAPKTKNRPLPFPTIAKTILDSRVHQNTRSRIRQTPGGVPIPCGFPPTWSQATMVVKPIATAMLATSKEVVRHVVRQFDVRQFDCEASECRSARFQPTTIRTIGARKRKTARMYMPIHPPELCTEGVAGVSSGYTQKSLFRPF